MAYATIGQALVELLGGLADGNIFDTEAPDNQSAPYIVFTEISLNDLPKNIAPRVSGFDGVGLKEYVMQIDVYASSIDARDSISKAIFIVLEKLKAIVVITGVSPVTSIDIRSSFRSQKYNSGVDNADPSLYRAIAEYTISAITAD